MSGVYLVVWDFEKNADTGVSLYDQILKNTKGGYPHITLFYSGKTLTTEELNNFVSFKVFTNLVGNTKLGMQEAYVNTFQLSDGTWRHDCLLRLDEKATTLIEQARMMLVQTSFPNKWQTFSMHPPHITLGIYDTAEGARKHADQVNAILSRKPRSVEIVGVTI